MKKNITHILNRAELIIINLLMDKAVPLVWPLADGTDHDGFRVTYSTLSQQGPIRYTIGDLGATRRKESNKKPVPSSWWQEAIESVLGQLRLKRD